MSAASSSTEGRGPARSSSQSSRAYSGVAQADEGAFLPGTLIGERYRMIARIGRGGMGEVYRATDIRLGQTVALKFLPEGMAHDPAALARFHNEVRVARQVTHPNVCRVYDIGEFDGQPFLSMEFIDGEDLGALLRRIGRLQEDKALEMARKLCAGLAAAHAQGVLHRDLKPANVMIDGRGQPIVTDFGLAALAQSVPGHEIRSGTPAYMAPEQLSGQEVSARSDIYSLGLVLFEMFTGKPAYEAKTIPELIDRRASTPSPQMRTLVRDLDPAIERVIARCLDPDPKGRPASALSVAAALPGGDPLAAALAAGETPSPEMVAAAGASEGLRPAIAAGVLAFAVIGLIAVVAIHSRIVVPSYVDLELPPEALAVQARNLAREFGYTTLPVDRAWTVNYDSEYINYLDKHRPAKGPPVSSDPSPVHFWYRESPRPLDTTRVDHDDVTFGDPPLIISSMVRLELDSLGRLRTFEAVPPQVDTTKSEARPPNVAALFAAAGLDMTKYSPAPPQWTPLTAFDWRAAWTGPYPGRPDVQARIEAAAWHGKPVSFQVIGPWTLAAHMVERQRSANEQANFILFFSVIGILVTAGSLLAWRNIRLGRGDRQSAFRLGAIGAVLYLLHWAFTAHHIATAWELNLLGVAIAFALFVGAQLWIAYMAVEPFVRRHWPRTIITWTRLIGGKRRDALVARDILIGIAVGVAYDLVILVALLLGMRNGALPDNSPNLSALIDLRHLTGALFQNLFTSIEAAFVFLLLLFIARVLLRREWLAAVAFVASFAILKGAFTGWAAIAVPMFVIIYGFVVILLLRYGLIAVMACLFVTDSVIQLVFTTHFSAWYGTSSLIVTLGIIALAAYAFRLTTAGRPLLGGLLDQ